MHDISQTLIPNARPGLGVGSLEGGKEFYQECLNWHTSTKLTAQEIYDLGMSEVNRITLKMNEVSRDAWK